MKKWELLLRDIGQAVHLPVSTLYTSWGKKLRSVKQIENGQIYVAAGHEPFKLLSYDDGSQTANIGTDRSAKDIHKKAEPSDVNTQIVKEKVENVPMNEEFKYVQCSAPCQGIGPRWGCGQRCCLRYGHRCTHWCAGCWLDIHFQQQKDVKVDVISRTKGVRATDDMKEPGVPETEMAT